MSGARVYVPTSLSGLAQLLVAGGVGPAPLLGHAVTRRLREEYPEGDEEQWEYVAMTAAAQDALGLLTDDDRPRRVVLALDAGSVADVTGEDPTLVELSEVVPLRRLAAVHVDSPDAEDAVAAARQRWAAAEDGDEDATAVVERCLDHELGWYAAQEIGDLLDQ